MVREAAALPSPDDPTPRRPGATIDGRKAEGETRYNTLAAHIIAAHNRRAAPQPEPQPEPEPEPEPEPVDPLEAYRAGVAARFAPMRAEAEAREAAEREAAEQAPPPVNQTVPTAQSSPAILEAAAKRGLEPGQQPRDTRRGRTGPPDEDVSAFYR